MKTQQLEKESLLRRIINRIKKSALFNVLNPNSGIVEPPEIIETETDPKIKRIFAKASETLDPLAKRVTELPRDKGLNESHPFRVDHLNDPRNSEGTTPAPHRKEDGRELDY